MRLVMKQGNVCSELADNHQREGSSREQYRTGKRGEVEFTHSCIPKDASYQQSLSFACLMLAYSRKTAAFE